jgi:protein-disulfide isomerase
MKATLEDHAQGRFGAEITLVQYGDYECPHTRRSLRSVRILQRELADRLLYVFRHFPLEEIHPHARAAAAAAEAAGAQGEFWRMHEVLFAHQTALDAPDLYRYAVMIGLDPDRFERDRTSTETSAHLDLSLFHAEQSGVEDTPTFFINGHLHDGPYDLETLRTAIAEISAGFEFDRS